MIEGEGGFVLSPQDRDLLRDLLLWFRQHRRNQVRPAAPPELSRRPDVYLARTASGIPAMTAEPGAGTDSSVGIISKADCKLYRIDDKDPNIDVDPLGVQRTVYNPSTSAIPANQLFLAVKDAPGMFQAVSFGGATRFALFSLPSALATTDASKTGCTVNDYWGGADPGATITVYNLPASSNYVFSGASGNRGLATYDERHGKWWIVQLQCP